ncbi:MAG TPA: hypothetical protein VK866_02115, partial [Acidimicrobiales bacterium]|nr:hypothetical protein [Acidimicrobiales bacterium]
MRTAVAAITIDQDAQDGEQIVATLGLVDDDGALERRERQGGFTEASVVAGVLEVEEVRVRGVDELTGERRLAHLTWAGDDHDRRPSECIAHTSSGETPINHLE